jgi:hypothetical protein
MYQPLCPVPQSSLAPVSAELGANNQLYQMVFSSSMYQSLCRVPQSQPAPVSPEIGATIIVSMKSSIVFAYGCC